MPNILKIIDGGFGSIIHENVSIDVGKIIFRISSNESMPVDHIGYCRPKHKESIIKSLKRLVFLKQDEEQK